jgi:hypothetical protein
LYECIYCNRKIKNIQKEWHKATKPLKKELFGALSEKACTGYWGKQLPRPVKDKTDGLHSTVMGKKGLTFACCNKSKLVVYRNIFFTLFHAPFFAPFAEKISETKFSAAPIIIFIFCYYFS